MLLKKRAAVKDSDDLLPISPRAGSSWAARAYERKRRASMPYCFTL
jgi:hypothetical protein